MTNSTAIQTSSHDSFVIKIEQPDETMAQYVARATAPIGEAYHFFTFPKQWTDKRLLRILDDFRTGIPVNRYVTTRSVEPDILTPQTFGKQTFQTIFASKIEQLYRTSLLAAQNNGHSLAIRLDVQPRALAHVPWEFLFDPREATEAGYLSFGEETPLIRFFDKMPRPPTYDPPLRLLLVSANAAGSAPLNLTKEYDVIDQAMRPLAQQGKLQVEYLFSATIEKLSENIRKFKPHIVHFMGHGGVDHLVLEDGMGLSSESLTINLRNDRSLRLVILNACQAGGVVTDSSGAETRIGVARSLAQAGIPAIVAMQFPISDEAAIIFAQNFYKLLVEECSVDEAVTWSRIAMQSRLIRGSMEWATPVLYMQTAHGRLFDDLLKPEEAVSSREAKPETKTIDHDSLKAERLQAIQQQLTIYYSNLNKLEEKAAKYGGSIHLPLELSNNLDDTKKKIEELSEEAKELTGETTPADGDLSGRGSSAEEQKDGRQTRSAEDKRIKLEIYYEEGLRYFDQEAWEKAIGFLELAFELDAHYRDTGRLLKTAREKLQEQEQQRQRQNRLKIIFAQAEQHFKAGRWQEALDLLRVIQKDDSTFQTEQVGRMIQQAQTNHQQALEGEIHQLHLDTLYQRAREASAVEDWSRAVYVLEALEQQSPGYKDAPELLREARRQQLLSDMYRKGLAAVEENNWDDAVAYLGQVHAWDADYKDVANKLTDARQEQNLAAHYQEGLEFLEAGRWREALEAFEPIPDTDLSRREVPQARAYAQARLHMAVEAWAKAVPVMQELAAAAYRDAGQQLKIAQQEKRRSAWFKQGQQALEDKRWEAAITAFKSITNEEAGYKNGEAKRALKQAERQATLEQLYTDAQRQLKVNRWAEAIATLEEIEQIDHTYKDVTTLLSQARQEKECLALYNQAKNHANLGEWPAAISKFEELLGKVSTGYLDAQEQLAKAQRQHRSLEAYRAAEQAMQHQEWEKVIILLEDADDDFLDTAIYQTTAKRQARLKQLHAEGKNLLDSARWDEAIIALEELQSNLKPDEPRDRAYADTSALLDEAYRQKELAETYHRAQEAMATQRWTEAIELLQEVIAAESNYEQASELLVKAQAERDFRQAYEAGRKAFEKKHWVEAAARFTEATRYKPADTDANSLHREATRQLEIEKTLSEGEQYEAKQDWTHAARTYRRIVKELDEANPEAIDRLSKAERQEKLTRLMAEADQAIDDENWTGAVEILENIVEIDDKYEDVSQKLKEAKQQSRLAELYHIAQADLEAGEQTHNWEKLQNAVDLFSQIEKEQSDYKDVSKKLQETRQTLQLLEDYSLAQRLFKTEQWPGAIEKLREIARHRPNYRDTAELLEKAQLNQANKEHWSKATEFLEGSEPSEADLHKAKRELEQIVTGGPSAYLDQAQAKATEVARRIKQLTANRNQRLEQARQNMQNLLDQQCWDEVQTVFDQLCELDPQNRDTYKSQFVSKVKQAAEAAEQVDNWEEAEKLWDLSIQLK